LQQNGGDGAQSFSGFGRAVNIFDVVLIQCRSRCCDDELQHNIRTKHSGNDIGAHPFQFDFRNAFARLDCCPSFVNLLLDFFVACPKNKHGTSPLFTGTNRLNSLQKMPPNENVGPEFCIGIIW
jgi:hypothetical protein